MANNQRKKLKINRTKISGSRQRLTVSGWILAALLLIAYNGSKLTALLSPPMSERSAEVKLASQKTHQLQHKISHISNEFIEDIDLDRIFLGISSKTVEDKAEPVITASSKNKKAHPKPMQLPTLSGILRHMDVHGKKIALAIIDGRRFKENDKVQGFKIQKIKNDGIVVTHSGQRWFLSAPTIPYSKVHTSVDKDISGDQ